MAIYDQLLSVCRESPTRTFTTRDLRAQLVDRFCANASSVIPSDHCYNRWNVGLRLRWLPIFERLETGEFSFLGPDAHYTGLVYARPRGAEVDRVVGEWNDGVVTLYATNSGDVTQSPEGAIAIRDIRNDQELPLSAAQIARLLAEYSRILKLETTEFGCKPTETRHLAGRLGELYCASRVGGTLATRVNQCGFDVIAPSGRTISVKTTAQQDGFVPIRSATLDRVDDLMVLQYDVDKGIDVVFYGEAKAALSGVRFSGKTGCFELDLSRARRLASRESF